VSTRKKQTLPVYLISFQYFINIVVLWTSMIQFCEQAWKCCLNRNLVSQWLSEWCGLDHFARKVTNEACFYKWWHFQWNFLWWPSAL